MKRLLLTLMLASLLAGSGSLGAEPVTYSFEESLRHGVIDFVVNPWAAADVPADLAAVTQLAPGLINRLGFEYGGVSAKRLESSGDAASELHRTLPRARIGGGFPENLRANYNASLPCNTEEDIETFTRSGLTGKPFDKEGSFFWIDPSLNKAQDYYVCIGEALIRRHFNHFHFEESDNILAQCDVAAACVNGYKRIRSRLIAYAALTGVELSFSGEPRLAREIMLDSVYIPARFYIDDFDEQYRNKVKTSVGIGYTYVLSQQIISDVVATVPHQTKVLFYVDNFDSRQDDLRRMMELDAPNRRRLIGRSAEVAAAHGVIFVPSFNTCDGCVPLELVGDACESRAKLSVYNARVCNDLTELAAAIRTRTSALAPAAKKPDNDGNSGKL